MNLVIDDTIDEVYQLAADMGGAEFVFSGENDSEIMHNSALINLHICDVCVKKNIKKVFYSSSACMYPEHNQIIQIVKSQVHIQQILIVNMDGKNYLVSDYI